MIYNLLLNVTGSHIPALIVTALLPVFVVIPLTLLLTRLDYTAKSAYYSKKLPKHFVRPTFRIILREIIKLFGKETGSKIVQYPLITKLAAVTLLVINYLLFAFIPWSGVYAGSSLPLAVLLIVFLLFFCGILRIIIGWSQSEFLPLFDTVNYSIKLILMIISLILQMLIVNTVSGSLSLTEITAMQSGGIQRWLPVEALGTTALWKVILLKLLLVLTGMLTILTLIVYNNEDKFNTAIEAKDMKSGYLFGVQGNYYAFSLLNTRLLSIFFALFTVILFAGGYHSPFGYAGEYLGQEWLIYIEQFLWLIIKSFILLYFVNWIKYSIPKLGFDNIKNLFIKYVIPVSIALLITAAFIKVID